MDALEPYLAELRANRLAGAVPETSGYGALATLLNEVGHKLKPKVRCVINPANPAPASPTAACSSPASSRRAGASRCPASCRPAAPSRSSRRAPTCTPWPQSEQVRQATSRSTARCWSPPTASSCWSATTPMAQPTAARELLAGRRPRSASGRWPRTPRKARRQHGERLAEFLKRCLLRQAPDRRTAGPRLVPRLLRPRGPRPRRGSATCPPWRPRARRSKRPWA